MTAKSMMQLLATKRTTKAILALMVVLVNTSWQVFLSTKNWGHDDETSKKTSLPLHQFKQLLAKKSAAAAAPYHLPPLPSLSNTETNRRIQNLYYNVCGELCDMNRPTKPSPSGYFDTSTARIDCAKLLRTDLLDQNGPRVVRKVGQPKWKPSPEIPEELKPLFSLNSTIPIEKWYVNNGRLGKVDTRIWTRDLVEDWKARAKKGIFDFGNYKERDQASLYEGLLAAKVENSTILVIGSESPWVEALCLAAGARHVTTLEYAHIISEHEQIDTLVPSDFRSRFSNQSQDGHSAQFLFDVIVSYSSLEHSGLGRYGDALNPWGDVMALARAWCVTKPQTGRLVLGLSCGNDTVYDNAQRIYGPRRWPYMATNWVRMNYKSRLGPPVFDQAEFIPGKTPHYLKQYIGPPGSWIWQNQSAFIFRKTGPPGSPEELKGGALLSIV